MKTPSCVARLILFVAALPIAQSASAQSLQDRLFAKVQAGASCNQTSSNGLVCEYKVGDRLSFSIKDAGGTDTVVGFNQSSVNEEFYAVLYFGCVVVVPGHAHPRNYDREYGVHVSPKNGRVYRTRQECQAAK